MCRPNQTLHLTMFSPQINNQNRQTWINSCSWTFLRSQRWIGHAFTACIRNEKNPRIKKQHRCARLPATKTIISVMTRLTPLAVHFSDLKDRWAMFSFPFALKCKIKPAFPRLVQMRFVFWLSSPSITCTDQSSQETTLTTTLRISMIGQANMGKPKSNIAMNDWLPQVSYPLPEHFCDLKNRYAMFSKIHAARMSQTLR